jgi:SAM-dependent methyltransferase
MKALVVIATYGSGNDRYLQRLVEEYRSMPFEVDLVVLSNIPKHVADGVEVVVVSRGWSPWTRRGTFNGSRNVRFLVQEYRDWVRHLNIPFAHRQIFADRLNDYDLFLYSEDDTLVTERNLRAFMSVSAVLPDDEIPGFLRFERGPDGRVNYPEVHGHFHWDCSSVRRRGEHTLAFFTNEHAACYVVTREQLRRAIDSGGFLAAPHGGKYDLLCTAATDVYTQCGFEKLICISQIDDFLVHHLPNRYVGTQFGVDDLELRRQVDCLLRIGADGEQPGQLFETETKLIDRSYSKGYYEPVRQELLSELPSGLRAVLSLGSGRGAVEAYLSKMGLRVTAVPLDAVIAGGAEAEGVEIVAGDFEHARRKLEGRQFDCLFMSNVLHLIPDPVGLLRSWAGLLPVGGIAIAVTPNTSRLEPSWRALRGGRLDDRDMYRTTGVQRTSRETVRSWFRSAGLSVDSLKEVLRPHAQKIERLTKGAMHSWLAYEFVVAASKTVEANVGRSSEALQGAGLRS